VRSSCPKIPFQVTKKPIPIFQVQNGGQTVPVLSSGAQGGILGLDQVNIGPLPASLAGKGSVNIVLAADGQTANTVNVTIQ
jgi:uncharacterized protein (TIGR03437 family)